MDEVLTTLQRWIEHHPPALWAVILAAAVLAWIDHARRMRGMSRYDGWWFNNLRRSDVKSSLRRRRS